MLTDVEAPQKRGSYKNKKLKIDPKIWGQTAHAWVIENFYAIQNCPNCKFGILNMKDEPTEQLNVINRHVRCENCGITEMFRMPTPDYGKSSK